MNYKILFILLLPTFFHCSEPKDDVEVVHVRRITPELLPAFLESLVPSGTLKRTKRMVARSVDSKDNKANIIQVDSGDEKK